MFELTTVLGDITKINAMLLSMLRTLPYLVGEGLTARYIEQQTAAVRRMST